MMASVISSLLYLIIVIIVHHEELLILPAPPIVLPFRFLLFSTIMAMPNTPSVTSVSGNAAARKSHQSCENMMLFSEKLVRFMPKNDWEKKRRGDGQSHVLLGIVVCRRVCRWGRGGGIWGSLQQQIVSVDR